MQIRKVVFGIFLAVSALGYAASDVATIDVRATLTKAPLVRAYGRQIAAKVEPRFQQLKKRADTVRADSKNFIKEASLMSLNARESAQKRLNDERQSIGRDRQKAINYMRGLQSALAQKVDEAFNQSCEKVAKAKKIKLVIRKSAIITNLGYKDLTDDVLPELNKALAVIELPSGITRVSPKDAQAQAAAKK